MEHNQLQTATYYNDCIYAYSEREHRYLDRELELSPTRVYVTSLLPKIISS